MNRFTVLVVAIASLVPAVAAADAGRFTGVWEGTSVEAARTRHGALVCRPRGDVGVAGTFYVDGSAFGDMEDGRASGGTLTFHSGPLRFTGVAAGDSLELILAVPHGQTHTFRLARVSADTLRLPPSLRDAPPAPTPIAIAPAPDSVYRAHDLPASTTSNTHPCLEQGTLFLVGGGAGQSDLFARFVKLAGDADAALLDLPDASMALRGTTEPPDGRALAALLGVGHVGVWHAASRAAADSESFVGQLRAARGLWIDGGEPGAIIDRYMGTRAEREMVALLARGGVIGGTSAGAVIWGSRAMILRAGVSSHLYAGVPAESVVIGHPHEPAFGLLRNVAIVPHFAEFKLEAAARQFAAAYPGLLVIGIDEATALEVHAGVGAVLGRGHVTVFDGRQHGGQPFLVLSSGARYDLRTRAVI